jgi:hypothetical protein
MTYWLKALGWPDVEQYNGLILNQDILRIDFPTGAGNPGMEIGDISIVFGIGVTNILYVARITGAPYQANPDEIANEPWRNDYIWSVDGNNLFPNFGLNWRNHAVNPFSLVDDFHNIFPETPVTLQGNMGLGAINRGNDRIRLTPEFGLFVIGNINTLDR